MAIEQKRGCGYRKVGGLYMVGGGIGIPCDRLPFELTVCACCGQGIKQARGWTWIDVGKFFNGPHLTRTGLLDTVSGDELTQHCDCGMYPPSIPCPLCHAPHTLGRAGLLWIGEKFYKTPQDFVKEGVSLGFSRRIKAVPQGFKLGETYVLLAHPNAIVVNQKGDNFEVVPEYKPGIFYAWLPSRLERIYTEDDRGSEAVKKDEKRGIVPVFVPTNDKDHQGNVHDDYDREQKEKESGGDEEI